MSKNTTCSVNRHRKQPDDITPTQANLRQANMNSHILIEIRGAACEAAHH